LTLRATRKFRPRWLTVLAYHRVFDLPPDSPWDPDLVSASPEMFRRQMDFVKRHFTCIRSEHVRLWKEGKFEMPANPIIITFDDGYLDAHDVALPLLREAGLIGEFFVCPWQINQKRLFWWERIMYCARRSKKATVSLDYPRAIVLDLSKEAAAAAAALVGVVKNTRGLDLERFLDEVQERTEVELDEAREAEGLLMNWEQIRALRRAGMAIGSHSYSHPILSLSENPAASEEMARSKAEIEAQLNERICSIAYPVGRFTEETKRLARQAGYDVAYSYRGGANFLRSSDFFEIRRVAVERGRSLEQFRMLAALPFLR
jgi:peptidoglycan/xylan/chitin deacetylase (PgdA/CDA1 family)